MNSLLPKRFPAAKRVERLFKFVKGNILFTIQAAENIIKYAQLDITTMRETRSSKPTSGNISVLQAFS